MRKGRLLVRSIVLLRLALLVLVLSLVALLPLGALVVALILVALYEILRSFPYSPPIPS